MSFDLATLRRAVAQHGTVARVVIADLSGSSPREAGASMLVWYGGQSGTIGGGALEHQASATAREILASGNGRLERIPLGPALGQCCGGAVTLVWEVFCAAALEPLSDSEAQGYILRPVGEAPAEMPLPVRRLAAGIRNGSTENEICLTHGWLLEPLACAKQHLWIYGAGHVGRAVVSVFAPLPDWQVTWVDTHAERFPDTTPNGVDQLAASYPVRVVAHAPPDAHHLVMTYSHALDLDLCHAILGHRFSSAGVIGSQTKWARFRGRLRQLGHSDASISSISCPIGDPTLGKHPQSIAIGVASTLLKSIERGTGADMDLRA